MAACEKGGGFLGKALGVSVKFGWVGVENDGVLKIVKDFDKLSVLKLG